jgi:YMGG-like Gly-zipper
MRTIRSSKWLSLVPLAAVVAACGRGGAPALDDALKNDLALASQAQAYNAQFVSPLEAGYGAEQQYAPRTIQTVARQPVTTARRTTTTTARRPAATRSSASYPAQEQVVVKHTERDAAIGAAAGAIIGAVSSRDKVKGGLIGAGVGGILGAVIGNNVDIQRKTPW